MSTIICRRLIPGEEFRVGDCVRVKNALRVKNYRVKRLTAAFAYIRYNDACEGRFRRVIPQHLKPLGTDAWCTTEYTPYRPIDPVTKKDLT